MRVIVMMLVAATALATPVPLPPEGRVSAEVVRAWTDAGAEVRWVATSGLWDDKPTPGCRAGFRFHGWVPGRLDRLPAPDAPFHLDVSFPWPGDESSGVAWEITDGGLKALARFPNLRSLSMFGKEITDAGAGEIGKLNGLERLDLSCTKVTASGLKELAKLRSLTGLSLSQMDVTEGMLQEVAGFAGLSRFDLSFNRCEVTAAGMRHLADQGKLEKLDFFQVKVSDAGARELGRSRSLRRIDFLNTQVTEAGAEELRKLLPGCATSARTVDLSLPPPPIPKN